MSPAFIERLLSRFHNVARRGEVGFADLQMYDALTFCFQRTGPDENIEGRFVADTLHSFREFHGVLPIVS